jgi:hypothetical protein
MARVQIANPAPKRAKKRREGSNMAAKRKRRAKRRAAANPKRKRAKARHRRANPKHRAKRRTTHRRRAGNPKRKRAKRRHAKNPGRRHARHGTRAKTHHRSSRRNSGRKRAKRRHAKNPGIPVWAMAGIAGALGLGSFALSTSAAFGLTKRFDTSMASLSRNRIIAGSATTLAGLLVAIFASPILGAGVMSGGFAALAGTQLSFAIDPVFQLGAAPAAAPGATPAAPGATPAAPTTKGLGGTYRAGAQRLMGIGGTYRSGAQRLSGLYNSDGQQQYRHVA